VSDASGGSDREWRDHASARAVEKARRRNTVVLLLVALAVIIAATAAFVVPMLITA
jgi:hypothetical protein